MRKDHINITMLEYEGEIMKEHLEKFMDDETTRIFCFFIRIKFDPESQICRNCARRSFCEKDAKKMLEFWKTIPWLETAYEREMKKYSRDCPVCG